jgi:hypothetical protein
MPPAGFEPAIAANSRRLGYAPVVAVCVNYLTIMSVAKTRPLATTNMMMCMIMSLIMNCKGCERKMLIQSVQVIEGFKQKI